MRSSAITGAILAQLFLTAAASAQTLGDVAQKEDKKTAGETVRGVSKPGGQHRQK